MHIPKKLPIFATMESLGRHIEALLQDADCVVLPGFGAFIAHVTPARYVDEGRMFLPPRRSLAFNSGLRTDDGLLTARLARQADISFSEARTAACVLIDQLRDTLAIDGAARLDGIGRLRQDMAGSVTFEPAAEGIVSPSLFGLNALTLYDLTAIEQMSTSEAGVQAEPKKLITKSPRTIDIHIGRQSLRRIASVAAAVLLMIVFAIPVSDGGRTDVASLGITVCPKESPVQMEQPDSSAPIEAVPEEPAQTEAPAMSLEPDAPAVVRPSRVYHVIAGSLPSDKGAEAVVRKYVDKGFEHATTVEGDGRVRISIASFYDKAEGEAYVKELRKDEAFKNVWLLSVKAR